MDVPHIVSRGALGRRRRPGAVLAALGATGAVIALQLLPLAAPAQAALVTGVDLRVSLSGPTDAVPGDTFTDTVLISNNGTLPATGVELDLAAPASGATYAISDPGVTCDGSWNCTLADLASGAQRSVLLHVTTAAPLTDGDTVTPQATVSTTAADVDPTNDTADLPTDLSHQGTLSVTIQRTSSATLLPGNRATYQATVTNHGPYTSIDPEVDVQAPIPPFSSSVAASTSSDGECHLQQGNAFAWCTWPTIPANGTRTMTFSTQASVHLVKGSQYDVWATTISSNSTASATDSSVTTMSDTTSRATDVSVTTSMTPKVKAGQKGTYKFTLTNHGPYRAHDVVLTSVLPKGFHWADVAGHKPQGSTSTRSTTIGDLESGAAITVSGWFRMAVGGHFSMQLRVTHADPDSLPSNNSSRSVAKILGPVVSVVHSKSGAVVQSSDSSTSSSGTSSASAPQQQTIYDDGGNVISGPGSSTEKKLADTGGPALRDPVLGFGLVVLGAAVVIGARERRPAPRHKAWISPYA